MAGLEMHRPTVVVVGLVADRRLYLAADQRRMVEEGSHDAASLLATPGWVIPVEVVARLGLRQVDGRIVQGAEAPESIPEPDKRPRGKKGKPQE